MNDAIDFARLIELGDDAFASECADMLRDQYMEIQGLQSRLESLEQEMQEQARIIGMGADRELALVAKVESLEKDAARLHGEIMNIAPVPYGCSSDSTEMQLAYKIGHRDARHAAAALVSAMQTNNGE